MRHDSREDDIVVLMNLPALFDDTHMILVRGNAIDPGIHMQVLLGQPLEHSFDVFLTVYRDDPFRIDNSIGFHADGLRSPGYSQPFRSTVDLHEMMIMEESDEGSCGEI
jgi:hypothetical protein